MPKTVPGRIHNRTNTFEKRQLSDLTLQASGAISPHESLI